MLKRLAYKIVYDDLTKATACGMFVGKHDATNGHTGFVNGVWFVMEAIAYGVSEKNREKFNDLFCENLERSERRARKVQTERSR